MMAELSYVLYSHQTCDHSPGERVEVSKKRSMIGFLLGPLRLCTVKKWAWGPSQTCLEGAYCGGLVMLGDRA